MIRCQECDHWYGEGVDYKNLGRVCEGSCSLNPEWVIVSSNRFCSQYSGFETKMSNVRQSIIQSENDRELRRQLGEQWSRAIKAEKKLKAVRAELREARKTR